MKKFATMVISVALIGTMIAGGSLAYLSDTDSDVNVMTLGNVSIEQQEWQRAEGVAHNTTASIDDDTLVEFKQKQPLYPAVPKNGLATDYSAEQIDLFKWGDYVTARGAGNGLWNDAKLSNVMDKIVMVKNTGKSDAYYRTLIAFECPEDMEYGQGPDKEFMMNINGYSLFHWDEIGYITVDEARYLVLSATYQDILEPGEVSRPSLLQVVMTHNATNEDMELLGEDYKILVLSQAVQAQGFADAQTALNAGFGGATAENVAEWFKGISAGIEVTPENISDVDFTTENEKFVLTGEFEAVAINELGEGSVVAFDNATVDKFAVGDDAVLTGKATITSLEAVRNSTEPIEVTVRDADLDIAGEVSVKNTDGKSILNIENSHIYAGTIYVGEHTNNCKSALAELNIKDSFVSCEENGLGSTINVWGRSGVKATIYDSEIYTYSRGWHQSEDANDNAITFQGATSIDVDIQRSNMHLYGARSIINARQYGGEETTINTNIEDSLIWVVTKSSHGENTIPVWGFDESKIHDSMLLFTKNVHQSTPAVFKSFVYGNPVIHGAYHVTTQCQWDAPIALADGQTVTFAKDANVSIYDDAGKVEFVKTGSANVVLENGAVVKNIGGIN